MKPRKKIRESKIFLLAAIIVIICDWFLQSEFRRFGFGYSNSGVSFGFADQFGLIWKFLLPVLVFGFIFWAYKHRDEFSVTLGCLLIGGLGNLLPRLLYGSVWDYINLSFLGLWINLSDVLIFLSVVSYILVADENRRFI